MMEQKTINVQGNRVNFWLGGQGAPLLLIHGGIGNAEVHWSSVWNQLAKKFTVIAPNLPSFGETGPLARAGFVKIADWVVSLMNTLQVESAFVAGNSFGGGVARLLASRHERRVRHLILINGGAIPNIPPFVGRMMQIRLFDGLFNIIRRQTFSYKGLAPMFADKSFLTNEFIVKANSDSLGFVTLMRQSASEGVGEMVTPLVPTLVLWGEADKFTKLSMGRNLKEMIPHAALQVMMNAGHMPQIEKPDEFVWVVSEFLS